MSDHLQPAEGEKNKNIGGLRPLALALAAASPPAPQQKHRMCIPDDATRQATPAKSIQAHSNLTPCWTRETTTKGVRNNILNLDL